MKKNSFGMLQLSFYSNIIFFLCIIAIFYPGYFKVIIPLTLCYETGFNYSFLDLLFYNLAYIILLLVILILVNITNFIKNSVIIIAAIAMMSAFLIYLIEAKIWFYHLYPALALGIILLVIIIGNLYEKFFYKYKSYSKLELFNVCFAQSLILYLLMITVINCKNFVSYFHNQSSNMNLWIQYSNRHFFQKKLFFFLVRLYPAYPLNLYSNIHIVSPWPNLWFIPSIVNQPQKTCSLFKDEKIFFHLATQGLLRTNPDFLIFPVQGNIPYLLYEFNIKDFFSKDSNFAQILYHHYFYYQKFNGYDIYKKRSF